MVLNTSGSGGVAVVNASIHCHDNNMSRFDEQMEQMYTYFYLLLFIPGLILNTTALWVLCRYISKKTKAVIFMINLAFADLVHILSLPLRIYYYFTHYWPFGRGVCLFCFYLKYLNMYAAIMFLMCISVQRCVFLLKPFSARRWRRRYDLLISFVVWVVVSVGCSPFIFMRSSFPSAPGHLNASTIFNMTYLGDHRPHQPFTTSPKHNISEGCFKDLPMRHVSLSTTIFMIACADFLGFLIPLLCIIYSSYRIARSLTQKQNEDHQNSFRNRTLSFTSNGQSEKYAEKQTIGEKRRALRMVLSCSALFSFCFAPYHINFLLYLLVSQDVIADCGTRIAVRQFHPVSLCMASLSCCFNPLMYYFLTAEFRQHFTQRTSSFTGSLLSSPLSSPKNKPVSYKPKRMNSTLSECD